MGGERGVRRPGRAVRHAGPLRHADAGQSGRAVRGAGDRTRGRDGSPGDLADLRGALPAVPGHPVAHLDRRCPVAALRHRCPPVGAECGCRLRCHRPAADAARFPAPRALRPVRDGGDRDHRLGARRPFLARAVARRRLVRAGRADLSTRCRDRPRCRRLRRRSRPSGRDRGVRHRHLVRLSRCAPCPPGVLRLDGRDGDGSRPSHPPDRRPARGRGARALRPGPIRQASRGRRRAVPRADAHGDGAHVRG